MARGSIRQVPTAPGAPPKWQLRAYAGMSPEGKERWVSKTVTGPRRAAEEHLAALVMRAARLRDGGQVNMRRAATGALTVREAFEAWRQYAGSRLEPNGADTDEDILNNYVYPHLGDVELWRLRADQVAAPGDPDHDPDIVSLTAYYAMLAERGTAGRRYGDGQGGTVLRGAGRPLGSQAIRRTHGVIRRALEYCLARNWVSRNAAVGAKLPPVVKRQATTPAPATLAAFVEFLQSDDPVVFAFVHLMGSGARRVDMALTWAEVSFGADGGGAVTFGARGLISRRGPDGKPMVEVRTTPTRKRRLRTVALDPVAASCLMAHRMAAEAEAALCGVELGPDTFVFSASLDGLTPRPPWWFSGAFRYAKERAAKAGVTGLAGVRPYDVRHFMITQLLSHGVPPAVVAERAGNSQRTMDAFYRHAAPARDQAAAELLGKILRDSR